MEDKTDSFQEMFVDGMSRLLAGEAAEHEGHGEWHGTAEHLCPDGKVSRRVRESEEKIFCARCKNEYCPFCDLGTESVKTHKPNRKASSRRGKKQHRKSR